MLWMVVVLVTVSANTLLVEQVRLGGGKRIAAVG